MNLTLQHSPLLPVTTSEEDHDRNRGMPAPSLTVRSDVAGGHLPPLLTPEREEFRVEHGAHAGSGVRVEVPTGGYQCG